MARVIERSNQRINLMLPGLVITALVAVVVLLLGLNMIPTAQKVEVQPFVIAIFSVVFLSSTYFIYTAIQKLKDKSPGLLADADGLTYNISPLGKAIGKIRWDDIKSFKENEDIFITVMVKNPEHYLKRITNAHLRKQTHTRACVMKPGALLLISSHGLKCDYDELKHWLDNRLAEHSAEKFEKLRV